MKSVTKNLIMLVMFLLFAAAHVTTGDERQLQLEIGLSKTTFLLNEPIWLDVTLTNVSQDTVRIFGFWPPAQGDRFGIEIKNRKGEILPHTGPRYNVLRSKGWIVEPEEQYYGCFNLLELFNTYRGLRSFFWQILPVGSYRVRTRYEGIYSEEIEFEVVQPTEDQKAPYQFLLKADSLLWQEGVDSMKQKLQELINRFPNSVYAEKAHSDLSQDEELLQRFPNSGYNGIGLKGLTRELADEEKREFLEKVIRDHTGSRSARYAQQMLARPELVGD